MPFFPRSRQQKSWGQGECPAILAGDLLSQGQLLLPLFFWEVLNQGMLTSNVLWHGYYNQAQGLCRKISTCNYKGLSANLEVPCFIFKYCSETQWCGIWCLWIRAHRFKFSQREPGSSHTAATNVARRGSGSGPVHSCLEEAVTEESVNHAGLLQFGIEHNTKINLRFGLY